MNTSGMPRWGMAVSAAVLFGFVLWFDTAVLEFSLLAEDTHPDGSPPFLFRTAVLISAAGLLFSAILQQDRRHALPETDKPAWFEDHLRWGMLSVVVTAVVLFLMDEQLFHDLGLEDHVVEQVSTLSLFSVSVCFLWLFGRLARLRPFPPMLWILAAGSFAGVFFFLGMEEISWFQRVFRIETPDSILQLSERDEINIHNMYTALAENVYYFGAFVFLVGVPFLHERRPVLTQIPGVAAFIPTRTVILLAAPAFAFNYDMWNLAFIQFAFWFSVLVVGYYTWKSWTQPEFRTDRMYTLSVLLTMLLAQGVFIAAGERFVWMWDTSEYKELIIPLSFLAYTVLTVRGIRGSLQLPSSVAPLASAGVMILTLVCLVSLYALLDDNVSGSELDILMLAKRFAEPDFLSGEFSLNQSVTPRTAFLTLLFPLVDSFSLMTVSIIGRLIQFGLLCTGVGLIARRLGLNALSASAVLGLYFWFDQSLLPGGDDLFRNLEAMNIAYTFLFFGLYALLDRKLRLAALWAGAATSFHLIVGIWGSLALGLTVLSERMGSWGERAQAAGVWCVGGIVGLVYLLSFLAEPLPDLAFDINYIYVYFRNPHDLDPVYWDLEWGQVWPAVILCWVLARVGRYFPDRSDCAVVARFSLWSLLPFGMGLLLAPFSFAPHLLRAYPFRAGGTILLLFGSMIGVLVLFQDVIDKRAHAWLATVAAVYCFWLGGGVFIDNVHQFQQTPRGGEWRGTKTTQALYDVCDWIRQHTEPDALIITAPNQQSVGYLCRRPVAVRFKSIPYRKADMAEWYTRLIAFNGGEEPTQRGYRASREIAKNFRKLSAEAYRELGRRYGGRYLLIRSRKGLALPKLYQNKKFMVFRLDAELPGQSTPAVQTEQSIQARQAGIQWEPGQGVNPIRLTLP